MPRLPKTQFSTLLITILIWSHWPHSRANKMQLELWSGHASEFPFHGERKMFYIGRERENGDFVIFVWKNLLLRVHQILQGLRRQCKFHLLLCYAIDCWKKWELPTMWEPLAMMRLTKRFQLPSIVWMQFATMAYQFSAAKWKRDERKKLKYIFLWFSLLWNLFYFFWFLFFAKFYSHLFACNELACRYCLILYILCAVHAHPKLHSKVFECTQACNAAPSMPFDTDTNIHIGRVHLRRAERSGANKKQTAPPYVLQKHNPIIDFCCDFFSTWYLLFWSDS